jgi:hypothetical protein
VEGLYLYILNTKNFVIKNTYIFFHRDAMFSLSDPISQTGKNPKKFKRDWGTYVLDGQCLIANASSQSHSLVFEGKQKQTPIDKALLYVFFNNFFYKFF